MKGLKTEVNASEIPQGKDLILGRIQEVNSDIAKNSFIIAEEDSKYNKYHVKLKAYVIS